jgi:hypothetical protein
MAKKIFIGLGIFLLLLLGAAILLPIIYKDEIIAKLKTEINNNVNAKVDFGNLEITLIRTFPDLTLQIENLSVVGVAPFQGDTLTRMAQLDLSLNLMSVIKGQSIEINSIRLAEPLVNLIVLKDGKTNWDIAKPDSAKPAAAGEEKAFHAALESYSIENGNLYYNDASLDFQMALEKLNHSGNGDFTQDLFTLQTNTTSEAVQLWYGGVKYLHNINTAIQADIDMDMPNMKFTFKENKIQLNELAIGFDGFIAMPAESIVMDFKYSAKQNEFRHFLSMIPGVYRDGFKDLKSSGSLALDGFVKGVYNDTKMPGFGLKILVKDGKFQYPSLPTAVNDVQVDLDIRNADGIPDHTEINLNKMHVELGAEPFDAKMHIRTPVSDAQIDGMIKGHINFANIGNIVPLEKGTTIKGEMDADLSLNGRMSAIEQKRYEDFKAAGRLALRNFNYSSNDYKQGFDLTELNLTFNPQNVTLNTLKARMGGSDINADGTLDNLLAYYFKNEKLKGTLNLRSSVINLDDFSSGSTTATPTPADTAAMTLIEVPANLDFVINTSIGRLKYDNVDMSSITGRLTIRDQAITMENLSMILMDGAMQMSGSYATRERKKADMAFNLDIKGFDIQKTVQAFATVKKLAPIAERATGRFGTVMKLNGQLDEHMNPILPSLNGYGKLTTTGVVIENFPPLVKLADALKMEQYKKLDVTNVNASYKFENGRVTVEPFDMSLGGIPTNVSGSTGFDQTIDYTLAMNIPTSKLPSQATGAINSLISQANAKGANFSMAENVKVNVKIGGTVSQPVINTGIKETTGALTNQLKDKANEEIDKLKAEAEAKAKAEAERLKKEATDKANAEAERLKKEAEDKAKAEAERLKKEAEKKAKEELKKLFGK